MIHDKKHQHMTRIFNFGLLIGALIWVVLVVRAAHILKDTSQHIYEVNFGPLLLTTLRKETIAGAQTVQFDFGSGLLWYTAFWLVASSISSLLLVTLMRRRHI